MSQDVSEEKKASPDILFLFPGVNREFTDFILDYHLGVGYILAYLKEKNIPSQQFIYKEPIDLDTLTNKILQKKAKVIGFTCYDTNYYFVKLISQLLKKKNPNLTILAGGPTATFSDKLIMQDNPDIDICVRQEGEHAVYELLQQLKASQDIANIQGITYRQNGRIIQTAVRPLIRGDKEAAELDILPSPYLSNIFPDEDNFGILTSRGCIFKCIYCNFSAMSRWTVRYHSIERVLLELKTIEKGFQNQKEKTKTILIEIFDDTFSLDITRAKQICQRIIEEKIHLPLWIETRADRVDRELLGFMHQAGIQQINFGLESASAKVLYSIKKLRSHSCNKNNLLPEKSFLEKLRKNVKLAKEIGLKTTVSVIIGLPTATLKDDKKTIRFVRQLKVENFNQNYLRIFPGTELFKTHKNYGLRLRPSLTLLPYRTEHTYDISKIPEIENSVQRLIKRNQTERIMKIISGDYSDLQKNNYPDLLFSNSLINSNTLEWIKDSIAINPIINFISKDYKPDFLQQNMKKMISLGLPVTNLYFLTSLNHKYSIFTPLESPVFQHGEKYSELTRGLKPRVSFLTEFTDLCFRADRYKLIQITEILTRKRNKFLDLGILAVIPFANFGYNDLSSQSIKKLDFDKVIFSISNHNDIENILKLAYDSNNIVLKDKLAKFDCFFLDECRWSKQECPAVRFCRAIIKKDGTILPCFNGQPIAKVGEDREGIIKKLKQLWEDTKRIRGCNHCPIKDSCAKCLFPYPVSSKDYCKIRKGSPNLHKVFTFFKIIRRIKALVYPHIPASKFNKIVDLCDNELAIIKIGKKRYLYNERIDKIYERS